MTRSTYRRRRRPRQPRPSGRVRVNPDCAHCPELAAEIQRLTAIVHDLVGRLEQAALVAEQAYETGQATLDTGPGVKRGNWAYARGLRDGVEPVLEVLEVR